MKRIIFFMSLAVLVQYSHGLPMMETFVEKMAPSLKSERSQQCTDFTGRWNGICTVNGEKPSANYLKLIQTGCSILSSNSELLFLGGTAQTSLATLGEFGTISSQYVVSADWAEGNSKVQITLLGSAKVLGKAGLFPYAGNATFSISGENLKYEMKFFDTKIECTYDRES